MHTVVFASPTAGTGKSAVAAVTSHYLVRQNRTVLAIGLDPGSGFGRVVKRFERAVCVPFETTDWTTRPCVSLPHGTCLLLRGAKSLETLEHDLAACATFAADLRDVIASVRHRFEICVIDAPCHPSVRLRAALALAETRVVVTPWTADVVERVDAMLDLGKSDLGHAPAGTAAPATDQRTHPNACVLRSARCYHEGMERRRLSLIQTASTGTMYRSLRDSVSIPTVRLEVPLSTVKRAPSSPAWKALEPVVANLADFVLSDVEP